jgi:hypothetical protein
LSIFGSININKFTLSRKQNLILAGLILFCVSLLLFFGDGGFRSTVAYIEKSAKHSDLKSSDLDSFINEIQQYEVYFNSKDSAFFHFHKLIGRVTNGVLDPEVYDYPVRSSFAVSAVLDGYQLVQDGFAYKFRRVPDLSEYNEDQIRMLTEHKSGHVLERHGHDVTDVSLLKRARTGTAPDGKRSSPPAYSSKFYNSKRLSEALQMTAPGTAAFNVAPQRANRKTVDYKSPNGAFGVAVPRGSTKFIKSDVIRAIYEEVDSGVYQLLTMYPHIK